MLRQIVIQTLVDLGSVVRVSFIEQLGLENKDLKDKNIQISENLPLNELNIDLKIILAVGLAIVKFDLKAIC